MDKLFRNFINLVAPLAVLALTVLALNAQVYPPIFGLGIIAWALFRHSHRCEIAAVFDHEPPDYPRYPLLIGACVTMIGVILS
jgi:hypothetical protein